MLKQMSQGLSVIADVENARAQALANKHLGNILVRYHLPDDFDGTLMCHQPVHPYHLTLKMEPLTGLAEFLDTDWWEIQDFNSGMAG